MKILQDLRAIFITVVSEEYTSKKTGQTGLLYHLTIMEKGKACTLPCTKELFEKCQNFEVMTEVDFVTEFNVDYKSYKVVDVR